MKGLAQLYPPRGRAGPARGLLSPARQQKNDSRPRRRGRRGEESGGPEGPRVRLCKWVFTAIVACRLLRSLRHRCASLGFCHARRSRRVAAALRLDRSRFKRSAAAVRETPANSLTSQATRPRASAGWCPARAPSTPPHRTHRHDARAITTSSVTDGGAALPCSRRISSMNLLSPRVHPSCAAGSKPALEAVPVPAPIKAA